MQLFVGTREWHKNACGLLSVLMHHRLPKVGSVILKEEPVDLELDGTSTFDSGEPSLEQKEEPYPEINYELESVVLDLAFPDQVVSIGATLPPLIKEQVIALLRKYKKVFAWKMEGMPGVSPNLIVHRLNIDPHIKPVQQKKRNFAPERSQAVTKEVRQLVSTD